MGGGGGQGVVMMGRDEEAEGEVETEGLREYGRPLWPVGVVISLADTPTQPPYMALRV